MAPKWTPAAVRRLRKKLDLTQEGLAHRLGVTTVSVNRWEQGHYAPRGLSAKALDALAKRA
jgi:DNA-binding transcriptional regulator YiaG